MATKPHDDTRSDLELTVRRQSLQDYARRPEKVGCGKDHWGRMGLRSRAEFDAFLLVREHHPESVEYAIQEPRGPIVLAFVNDNRWMARCECGGLAVVDPDDQGFYCHACFNMSNGGVPFGKETHGGYPRPVVFPEAADRDEIEAALLVSDDPLWRNWSALPEDGRLPGSARVNRLPKAEELAGSIEKVRSENEAAGLPRTRPTRPEVRHARAE